MAELIGTEKVVSGGNTAWQNSTEYAQKVKNIKGFLGFWRDALDNEFFPGMTAVYNNTDLYPLVGEIHFRCNNIEVKDGSDYDVKEGLTEVAIEFWVQDNNGDKVASDYLSIDLIPKIKDTERTNYKYDSNTRIHTYTFTTVEKSDKYSIDVTIKVEKWTQWGVDVPVLDNTHYTINIPANYKEYILTLTCTPTERKDKVKYSLTDGNSGTLDENPKEVTTREETGKVTFSVTDSDNYECKPSQVNWSEDSEINTICYEKNELVVKANFNRYDYDTKTAYVGFTAEIQKELKEDLSIEANMYFLNTQNPAVLIGNINKGEKTGTVNNSRLIVNSDVEGNIEKITVGVGEVKFGGNNFNNEYSNEVFNYVKIGLNTKEPSEWVSESEDGKRHTVTFYFLKNKTITIEICKYIVKDGYIFDDVPEQFKDKVNEEGFNLNIDNSPESVTYEEFKNYPITRDISFYYLYEENIDENYIIKLDCKPGLQNGYIVDRRDVVIYEVVGGDTHKWLATNEPPKEITVHSKKGTIKFDTTNKDLFVCEPSTGTWNNEGDTVVANCYQILKINTNPKFECYNFNDNSTTFSYKLETNQYLYKAKDNTAEIKVSFVAPHTAATDTAIPPITLGNSQQLSTSGKVTVTGYELFNNSIDINSTLVVDGKELINNNYVIDAENYVKWGCDINKSRWTSNGNIDNFTDIFDVTFERVNGEAIGKGYKVLKDATINEMPPGDYNPEDGFCVNVVQTATVDPLTYPITEDTKFILLGSSQNNNILNVNYLPTTLSTDLYYKVNNEPEKKFDNSKIEIPISSESGTITFRVADSNFIPIPKEKEYENFGEEITVKVYEKFNINVEPRFVSYDEMRKEIRYNLITTCEKPTGHKLDLQVAIDSSIDNISESETFDYTLEKGITTKTVECKSPLQINNSLDRQVLKLSINLDGTNITNEKPKYEDNPYYSYMIPSRETEMETGNHTVLQRVFFFAKEEDIPNEEGLSAFFDNSVREATGFYIVYNNTKLKELPPKYSPGTLFYKGRYNSSLKKWEADKSQTCNPLDVEIITTTVFIEISDDKPKEYQFNVSVEPSDLGPDVGYSLDNKDGSYTKLGSTFPKTITTNNERGTIYYKSYKENYNCDPEQDTYENGKSLSVNVAAKEYKFTLSCTPSDLFSHISYALDNKSGTYVRLINSTQEIRTGTKESGTIYFKTDNDEIYKCDPESTSYTSGKTVSVKCTEYTKTQINISVEIGEVGDNKLDVKYTVKSPNDDISSTEGIGIKVDFTVTEGKEGVSTPQVNQYSTDKVNLNVSKSSSQTITKQIDRKITNSKYVLQTNSVWINDKKYDDLTNQIKIYI